MPDDLNLSLDSVRKQKKSGRTAVALFVVATVLAALTLAVLLTGRAGVTGDPEVLEKLALRLEERELYNAAADTWIEYLGAGSAGDEQRARIWYRIGRMREKAGDCERALAAYYRSEGTARLKEIDQEISMAVERCLTRLARFAALRAELAERTTIGSGEGKGAEVLAEIGSEKITRETLEKMIEAEVDAQVAQIAAGLPEDQVREQRGQILDQVMKETDLAQWLENLVAEELLFRYAMEEGLHEDEAVVEMSRRMERRLLTSQALAREYAGKVSVTGQEARDWYSRNGSRMAAQAGVEGGQAPPFEDVKDQVFAAVRMEKERAVQAALLERLREKYDVVIHRSKLSAGAGEDGTVKEQKQ